MSVSLLRNIATNERSVVEVAKQRELPKGRSLRRKGIRKENIAATRSHGWSCHLKWQQNVGPAHTEREREEGRERGFLLKVTTRAGQRSTNNWGTFPPLPSRETWIPLNSRFTKARTYSTTDAWKQQLPLNSSTRTSFEQLWLDFTGLRYLP